MGLSQKPILTFFFLFALFIMRGQDQLSLSSSEHMPFLSSELNPALSADPKVFLSIRLGGAAAFAKNDLSYYKGDRFNLIDLFKGRLGASDEDITYRSKMGSLSLRAEGPAVFISLGRSTVGLSTRIRSQLSAHDVAPELSRFIFNGFRFFPQYDKPYIADGSSMSSLTWGELELDFAHMIRVTGKDYLNVGIGLKRLYGLGHLGLDVENMDYLVTSQDIFINDFTGSYAISDFGFRGGNGWGADLGIVYKRTIGGAQEYIPYSRKSSCIQSRYRYMIGLAVNDIGAVNFKTNSFQTRTDQAQVFWPDYIDTELSSLGQLDSLLAIRVEHDQNVTSRKIAYKVKLPRSITLHGDYDLDKGFHISSVIIIPWAGRNEFDMRRLSSYSLTPRYVRTRFEIGIPFSLIDYDTFRMGLGLRFQYLYMGSDDLLRLFDGEDIYSADLYLGIHIPIFYKKNCGKGKRRGKMIAPCWGQ